MKGPNNPPTAKLVDHGFGLLDVSLSSYNHLIRHELPKMINDMRPIVWSEKTDGRVLSVLVQMRFAAVQKPMLTESLPVASPKLNATETSLRFCCPFRHNN
jgi:hypothetical protein